MFWSSSRNDFLKNRLACLVSITKVASESETGATNTRQKQLLSTKDLNITFGNYMFKVNNRNTRTRCEICSMLTIKKPERTFWCLYC